MERTDLFPTLQPNDILRHFRDSLGLTFVTEEMVLRPASEAVKQIFVRLFEIALNDDTLTQAGQVYPDFHEGSIPTVQLYWKLRSLLSKLGCKDDFHLQDFFSPDFKRTRKFFSAFINFIKFRTDEEIFSEQVQGVLDTSLVQEDHQKVSGELRCNQVEVETLRGKFVAQKDSVEEKEVRIEELERLKLKGETSQNQVFSAVQQLSVEVQTITDATNLLKRKGSDVQQKLTEMQQQVIPYPELLLLAMKKCDSALKSEQQSLLETEQKAKDMAKRLTALEDVQHKIDLAMSDLHILHMSKEQLTSTKLKENALAKNSQALTRSEELLKVKLTTGQRLIDTKSQQTNREKESVDVRLAIASAQLKTKGEELMMHKDICKEMKETAQKVKRRIEDIKATEKVEEEAFRKKMKQATDALDSIKQAWEKYNACLASFLEKLKTETPPGVSSQATFP